MNNPHDTTTAGLVDDQLFDVDCAGCSGCCREPVVALTHLELQRLADYTHLPARNIAKLYKPKDMDIDDGEEDEDDDWFEYRRSYRMLGLKKPDGRCIFLGENDRCRVYAERPLTCRLYPRMIIFSEDVTEGFEMGEFNSAGVDGCGACAAPAAEPADVQQLYERTRDERFAYWELVRQWEQEANHRKATKAEFLEFIGCR